MSLDVCLKSAVPINKKCPHCGSDYSEYEILYDANITHNLGKMAKEAGVYYAIWRPEEIGIKEAGSLIGLLEDGLNKLESNPEFFKRFNPDNGWGTYGTLVLFVREYLVHCREYPESLIEVSR